MRHAGTWGTNPRTRSAVSTSPTGLGGGTNARGSVGSFSPSNATTGPAQTNVSKSKIGKLSYGGVGEPSGPLGGTSQPAMPSYIDATYQLNMAQRTQQLEAQRFQSAFDKQNMQGRFADRQLALGDQSNVAYDQLFSQLGGGNLARSGMSAQGQADIGIKYKQSLAELQRSMGARPQMLIDNLLGLAQKQYQQSLQSELSGAEEREILRTGFESPSFTVSPSLDYTPDKKVK